ncbi:hypothetical protein ABIF21_000226 [Bradyrhizobium elkanii]
MIDGTWRGLVGLPAQTDARVQRRRQQMVDDVETLLAARIVDRGHVGDVDEAAAGIVTQKPGDVHDSANLDVDSELIERDRVRRGRARKRAHDRLPKGVELAVVHT